MQSMCFEDLLFTKVRDNTDMEAITQEKSKGHNEGQLHDKQDIM